VIVILSKQYRLLINIKITNHTPFTRHKVNPDVLLPIKSALSTNQNLCYKPSKSLTLNIVAYSILIAPWKWPIILYQYIITLLKTHLTGLWFIM